MTPLANTIIAVLIFLAVSTPLIAALMMGVAIMLIVKLEEMLKKL